MNLKGKKVLITGSEGFIGSNLVRGLRDLNAEVVVYSKSFGQDIQDIPLLRKYIKSKFDIIYHLAGYSGPVKSNKKEIECFKINTLSTINLCELIVKYSSKTKLVLSGSRLEYGDPLYLPVDEKHPTNPTSAYGLSKLGATQRALSFSQKMGLRVTIFRSSNPYGPHLSKKFDGYNVLNYFFRLSLKNKEIKIFGRGEQLRDYLYIDDLIEAFLLASLRDSDNKIYNLGFGQGIKFKDMAKLITKGKGGKIVFLPWPKDYKDVETGDYISNIGKLKKELGFTPKISFEEGIEKTIKNLSSAQL